LLFFVSTKVHIDRRLLFPHTVTAPPFTLSLHDALPISPRGTGPVVPPRGAPDLRLLRRGFRDRARLRAGRPHPPGHPRFHWRAPGGCTDPGTCPALFAATSAGILRVAPAPGLSAARPRPAPGAAASRPVPPAPRESA